MPRRWSRRRSCKASLAGPTSVVARSYNPMQSSANCERNDVADEEKKRFLADASKKIHEMAEGLDLTPEEDAFANALAKQLVQNTMETYVEALKRTPQLRNKAMSAVFAYGLIIMDGMVSQREEAKRRLN